MARGSKFVRDLGIFLVLLCIAAVVYSRAATAPVALPNPAVDDTPAASGQQTAVLAGGCFWGIQAVFEHVKGVVSVSAGYSGGAAGTANYETVSEGTSGHAESVEITYDPARISYGQLLKVFFSVAHDPTELNRQGPDTGTQYRSAIFYGNENQQRIARAYIDQLNGAKVFPQRDRDAGNAAKGLLPRRGVSSGLPNSSSRQSLHHDQRSAEDRAPASAASRFVRRKA